MDSDYLRITLHSEFLYVNAPCYIPIGILSSHGRTIRKFETREGLIKFIASHRKHHISFTHIGVGRKITLL